MIGRGLTNAKITRLKRDNYLSLVTIEKICKTLDCVVDNILKFTDEEK